MFWPLVIAVPAVGASPRSVDSLRGANVFDNWLLGGLVVAAPPGGRSPAAHHTVHVAGPQARPPLASPPDWYDASDTGGGERRVVPRCIPMHVRQDVTSRDGNRCVGCGTTVNLHFDHVLPHSHGGPSPLDNLRILCAASNLARGAGSLGDTPQCAPRRRP